MDQLSYQDVQKLSYAQLGAIDDPMVLMNTTQVSPILIRYVVRTGQLASRYGDTPLPVLLNAVSHAAAQHSAWPFEVSQAAPLCEANQAVDAYLDALDALPPLKSLKTGAMSP